MTTLAVMKERVADEVARSDLTSMIAYAISDAIEFYQSKRLFFNETRDITFDTVEDQEWYDKYDHEAIPNLMEIDYVKINIDGVPYSLSYACPESMEGYATSTGQPASYTYFAQQIRLYPIPDVTVYEVRIGGQYSLKAPSNDDEKYNAWMTDAAQLIRARAKLNLARNVNAAGMVPTFDDKAIRIYSDEERDAFIELKMRTNKITSTGKIKPYY